MKLQASGIYRATNCPGSVALNEQTPEHLKYKPFKNAASFGTKVHDIAETLLIEEFQSEKKTTLAKELKKGCFVKGSDEYDRASNAIKHYQKHYRKVARSHKKYKGETLFLIEEKFRVTVNGVECVAKIDSGIVTKTKDKIFVDFMDLKTGNFDYSKSAGLQILFGALVYLESITNPLDACINTHTVQPNYYYNNERVIVENQLKEGATFEAAENALYIIVKRVKNNASTEPGDWCKFCPAVLSCPSLQARVDFTNNVFFQYEPADLDSAMLEALYLIKPQVDTFYKAVETVLYDQMEAGESFESLTVAYTSGRRRWIDPAMVEKKLAFLGADMYEPQKLKSPAQLEKLAGKENITDLYTLPKIKKLVEREQPFNKIK